MDARPPQPEDSPETQIPVPIATGTEILFACPACALAFSRPRAGPASSPACPSCGRPSNPLRLREPLPPAAPPPGIAPGEALPFGPYMHPRERGRGGMGAVDEARDPRLARPVALRMLGVEGERPDQPSVARFLREARAAANPRYARSWNNRASLKADRDDAAGALADDSRALELDPNSAVAWNNRGYTKAEAGDVAGALADYDEALRLHPGYALAYLNRGSARLGTGDSAGSAADFPRAVDLLPQGAPRRAVAEEALRQARGPAIPS